MNENFQIINIDQSVVPSDHLSEQCAPAQARCGRRGNGSARADRVAAHLAFKTCTSSINLKSVKINYCSHLDYSITYLMHRRVATFGN